MNNNNVEKYLEQANKLLQKLEALDKKEFDKNKEKLIDVYFELYAVYNTVRFSLKDGKRFKTFFFKEIDCHKFFLDSPTIKRRFDVYNLETKQYILENQKLELGNLYTLIMLCPITKKRIIREEINFIFEDKVEEIIDICRHDLIVMFIEEETRKWDEKFYKVLYKNQIRYIPKGANKTLFFEEVK